MDALIRSAWLAPSRTRLSDSRPVVEVESLRTQIERELRAEITAQAQKLYEEERKRAHADGYADGIADAKHTADEMLKQQRQSIEDRVATLLSAMEQQHRLALSNLQADAGEIAFAAVCRLVGNSIAAQPFVMGLIEQACAQLRGDEVATVRLHPRDIELLGERVRNGKLRIRCFVLDVTPDESLTLGGCVLDASTGQYDASLDGQLGRLHQLLAANPPVKR